MATSNVGLWRQLGISDAHPYFQNPCKADESIFAFPDAPHLIKLCRNHLLDKGYVLPKREIIKKEDLKQILSSDCGELKIHPRLKRTHFTCKGSDRQRVAWACQLLSAHTAAEMRYLSPEKKEQADFVQLMTDWFDIANSPSKIDVNRVKSGYGVYLAEQDGIVNEMIEVMSKTIQIGKKSLLPFQHGIIQWCHALKLLYEYVKIRYNVQWLMTCRVNQDHVENLSSQIRGLGAGYSRPGRAETLNRLRLLMITHSETSAKFSIPTRGNR
jgi:hypothetical protein